MKYCVPYFKAFKYMEEVDEIIIPYDEKDVNFMRSVLKKEELKTKSLIIDIQDMFNFYEHNSKDIFIELQQQGYIIKLRFERYSETMEDLYQELRLKKIPFFFNTYVRNWDTFHGLLNLGVSDVYIVEELGFELNLFGPVAHAADVSIRVFGNIAQHGWDEAGTIKSFFIRPEDIEIYSPYVDFVEFFGKTKEIQEVMYKVYAVKGKWIGDLNELILGLEDSIPNKSIMPAMFGAVRVQCGKKCLKGGHCQVCNNLTNIARVLNNKELIFN